MVGRTFAIWNEIVEAMGARHLKRISRAFKNRERSLRFEQCEDRRMLAVFTVNDPGDFIDLNPNVTTLREAVAASNASTNLVDTIKFNETVFANGGTIMLTLGQLSVAETTRLVIDGRKSNGNTLGITINANNLGADHLPFTGDGFSIISFVGATGGEQLEINSLAFSGSDTFASGVIGVSNANLALKNVTLMGNNGGAMIDAFASNVTVEDSTISGNFGLGINFDSQYYARQLNVVSSTISGNKPFLAGGTGITIDGGGISIRGDYVSAEIQSSTITGNERRSSGGGVSVLGNGTFDVVETIISGNKSTTAKGGGFYARLTGNQLSQAILSIDRSMILGNSAQGSGGGLFVLFGGRFTDPNIPDKVN